MTTERSDRIIAFMETLRLPDGKGAGEMMVLRDWQKDILRRSYDPCGADGRKLVRQAVLSMGRKGGKTSFVAALTLCHLCGPEAVRNGQLYSLSVDREQAGILFNYAKNIVYMDPELSKQLNVTESRKHIMDPVSGSIYSVLSGEKKGKMGKSSSFIAFDELAEFGNDRTLYDALLTSTAAHDAPMVWTFSTQAPSDIALLSELIDYGEKIRECEIEDDTFVSFLYTVPEEYDAWDEENWYLANPALGDFRSLTEMRDFAAKARQMPSMENSFRNLYLNQRVDAATPFISKAVFESCNAVPDELEGVEVYCGLDLSARTDLTALAVIWLKETVWQVRVFFYAPEMGVKDRAHRDGVPYDLWAKEGLLILTPGATVDYDFVIEHMMGVLSNCTPVAIAFDRWRIDVFKKAAERAGLELPLVEYGQGYKDQAPALDKMEAAFLNGLIAHGDHPILKMCVSNAKLEKDPAGNRKLTKSKSTGRIDGLAALSNAFGIVDKLEVEEPSAYETRGVLTF